MPCAMQCGRRGSRIELNGQSLVLTSATYHLPVKFAGVQIDCPITKGHVANSSEGNAWDC